jgi:hypothetical protein
MSKKSNWVACENYLKDIYLKYGIPASRVMTRNSNYAISDYDCRINMPFPIEFCSDSKRSDAGFTHIRLLGIIEDKYCKKKNQAGVLYCRKGGSREGTFSVKDEIFAGLLSYFLGCMTKEEVLAKWLK